MTSTPNKKKSVKNAKDVGEKYPPPEIDVLTLDENYLFNCSLNNEYQAICGAYDAKEHPLATFITEKGLLNKKNEFGKTPFDLAALIGNKDFIRTILQRTDEKIDENVFSLRKHLKNTNAYNFMHYACIWGRLDLVKLLVDQQKLIIDPNLESELLSTSTATVQSSKSQNVNQNTKTLGSILLRTRTKIGESPKDLARRYQHDDLVEFLNFAERRQFFIDSVNEVKQISLDPEKNQNKLSKDEKKKLEKVYADTMDWIDKNRESTDLRLLETKIKETEDEVRPILDKLIVANMQATSVSNITNGSLSNRSKPTTPGVK